MVPQDKRIEALNNDYKYLRKTTSCWNNKFYVGNPNDLCVVLILWIFYVLGSLYFFIMISPYFWFESSPAITIVGIFISIPGLYNAIKCFFTDPGVLKKGTYIIEEDEEQDKRIIEQNNAQEIQQKNGEGVENKQVRDIEDKKIKDGGQLEDEILGRKDIEIKKEEISIQTQKVAIGANRQQNVEGSELQVIGLNNQIEPLNKEQKPSPSFSLHQEQQQKEQKQQNEKNNIDEWIAQMNKGLVQIQNGLTDCDQHLFNVKNGLLNLENQSFIAKEVVLNADQNGIAFNTPFSVPPGTKLKGGNLYQERYCSTCKLKRPPLASHCTECNQCVKNFDHHCYFMGNCVGQRNHKNFYLFLWGSLIWTVYMIVFSAISFARNVKQNGFVFRQFYEEVYIFYVFVSLVALFVLVFICRFNEETIRKASLPAIIVTIISFFWIATYTGVKYYENPVIPLFGMVVYVFSALSLMSFAFLNCFLACIGSTLKQEDFKAKNKIQKFQFTLAQGCVSYYKFLTFSPPKSEILSE